MKTLLLSMASVALLLSLAGCETLADTKTENAVRVKNAEALNLKELNNDVEYVLYLDRPMWLSRYPIPND